MSNKQSAGKSQLLSDLPPYIYGTTRLGDAKIPFEDRVNVARAAMRGVDWFHTSHTYGDALQVLRAAFDQDRTRVPKLIVKIGWSRTDELRDVIHQHIDPLGLEGLELGQLCLSGELAEDYANGGECYKLFSQLKQEGLVNRFVLEVFPWSSDVALKALRGGYPQGIVDGYIFYLNPLQRFPSNELWDTLVKRDESMIAMRTVAGISTNCEMSAAMPGSHTCRNAPRKSHRSSSAPAFRVGQSFASVLRTAFLKSERQWGQRVVWKISRNF